MVDVIGAIQNSIDIVGKLRTLSKKIDNIDLKNLLADLSGDLADAKLEVAKLKVELATLTDENQSLKDRISAKTSSTPNFIDGCYVFLDDGGHYCTACYDTAQQRIRLTELRAPFNKIGRWQCPSCKSILG